MSIVKTVGSRVLLSACSAALCALLCSNSYASGVGKTATTPANRNLLGIGIAAPLDYEEDRLYADVIRMSRDFKSGTHEDSANLAAVDADGWPMSDFSFYVWAGIDKMHGTYTLTFKGQARVSGEPVGNIHVSYDSETNTSSGTFKFARASSSSLALRFAGTRRTPASAAGTGVTSIKLMRPTTPGAAQSYPASTLFNDPLKTLISKFSAIRFMDFLATNSNQQVHWSERPLPSWASFKRNPGKTYGWQGIGGPWEHVILLANETGKDAWINIPVRADDAYVLNVARLFAFGSDGVNPYTSPQAKPKYPPLHANLKLYVEYSNELWNSGGAFQQFGDNCQAASDELVKTAGKSPLNWDGRWTGASYNSGNWDNNWQMCWRRPAMRSVTISNIFRSVFGDAAMISRVRPMMMTQLGYAGGMLFEETKMMLNYYNNMAGNFVATPHPPNYYLYGAGGSGYYGPQNPGVASADALFADPGMKPAGYTNKHGPAGLRPWLQSDAAYVAALGLKRVAYEGGPNLETGVNISNYEVTTASCNDPRMTATMIEMHNEWSKDGGELFVYYHATGNWQWGFTTDVYNLATPKLQAIDALNAAEPAPLTLGIPVPGSIPGNAADACSQGYGCGGNNAIADGSKIFWASYSFRSSAAAPWTVNLAFAGANASVALYVDGALVATKSTSGGALSFNAGTVNPGLHGVIVRAVSGRISLKSVAVVLN